MNEIIPWTVELSPGCVPTGFSENVLTTIAGIDSPDILYDGSTTLGGWAQKWNGHGAEKNEIKSAQMFCEIQLGQLLGPNPGQGSNPRGEDGKFLIPYPHADTVNRLPEQRVKDFRRYFGWRDALVEAVRNGKRSRRSLLLLVDQWILEGNEEPTIEQLNILSGDFRSVLNDIEPNSISLILTDPPYPEEYLPLWDDLGIFAENRLVSGGSLVAYCGQSILPEALNRLNRSLRYWWTICLTHGKSQMLPGKWVSVGWKPLVWFVKDSRRDNAMLPDKLQGSSPRKTIETGDDGLWAQGVDEILPIISGLTAPGDLIVDPFAGSGTVGIAATRMARRFIGAELNDNV